MRFPLQTRYNDFDTKGHVNNAVYLAYFELARVQAWRLAAGEAEPDYILAEARITYRSPAMLGDPLAVEITTTEVRNKAWVWRYHITDERDERLIADGETTQVMYDYVNRRSVRVPDHLRDALGQI